MTHEPECPPSGRHYVEYCCCLELRKAYTRGYNDHARTLQHWQDTHGAYRAAPALTESYVLPESPAGPWPAMGSQHGLGENP